MISINWMCFVITKNKSINQNPGKKKAMNKEKKKIIISKGHKDVICSTFNKQYIVNNLIKLDIFDY